MQIPYIDEKILDWKSIQSRQPTYLPIKVAETYYSK